MPEKSSYSIKYAMFVKVPFEEKVGTGSRWSEKEGWITGEVTRVGPDMAKPLSDKELKALDENIKLVMGRVHTGAQYAEPWFRNNMFILENPDEKVEREEREAKMKAEQDKILAEATEKAGAAQEKLLNNFKGAKKDD